LTYSKIDLAYSQNLTWVRWNVN